MVLRRPRATISRCVPSGRRRSRVAFSGLASRQLLQVEPTLRYSQPSGPMPSVRRGWLPPSGRSFNKRRGADRVPSLCTSATSSARSDTMKSLPACSSSPCTRAMRATVFCTSATPSPSVSRSSSTSPWLRRLAYTSPLAATCIQRTLPRPWAKTEISKPGGSLRLRSKASEKGTAFGWSTATTGLLSVGCAEAAWFQPSSAQRAMLARRLRTGAGEGNRTLV